ncbi:probable galacturonosyltransferase 7 isoform X1 [Zingiber officinale]|uniref:probable galacturonosyltransferase 7 isoform X1 n=1 Tax=Zingiber officinale TaxID=94328 RepID=UPI001C4D5CAE|nr:probable galacturonosyltransferase 7 isoform X1 [Zingiber officinale]
MKGYGAGGLSAAAQQAAKRRWKGQPAAVFALVFFSLLVPLVFLLGLHNRFPSGYLADVRSQQESNFDTYHNLAREQEQISSKVAQWMVPHLEEEFASTFSKDVPSVLPPAEELNMRIKKTLSSPSASHYNNYSSQATTGDEIKSKGPVKGHSDVLKEPSSLNTKPDVEGPKSRHDTGLSVYETDRSCEHEFGSYCLWARKNRRVMKDSNVKRLKDQLFVARAYYPSIAKIKGKETLTRELKQNIQDHERILTEAVSDPDLPPLVGKKISNMDKIIAEAKSCPIDCTNIDRKLRQILDLTEDEAQFHMKQSAFLYQLGVQTMSKTFHCLLMRLTVEFFKSPASIMDHISVSEIGNPSYQHYLIFSKNILALSVTINSTVLNSEESDRMVFHVLTDKQNFYSMKHWFVRHSYGNATIDILNFDELKSNHISNLDLGEMSMSEEFRISSHTISQRSPLQMGTKYLSVFGHSHFLLADMFKDLKKVVLLDDDVIVQKDISFLWNLDLGGKVIGATEFCGVKLGHLKSYLGTTMYDNNDCAWMSGINIVDLEKWRELDITGVYERIVNQLKQENEVQWRAAALPANLLAFHGHIYTLDNTLVQQGLGHDYEVSEDSLKNAAALHYNGNMKPWLDLAIPKYKIYWKKYLTRDERYMEECNVNP